MGSSTQQGIKKKPSNYLGGFCTWSYLVWALEHRQHICFVGCGSFEERALDAAECCFVRWRQSFASADYIRLLEALTVDGGIALHPDDARAVPQALRLLENVLALAAPEVAGVTEDITPVAEQSAGEATTQDVREVLPGPKSRTVHRGIVLELHERSVEVFVDGIGGDRGVVPGEGLRECGLAGASVADEERALLMLGDISVLCKELCFELGERTSE